MAVQTGRTVSKNVDFRVSDSAGTLRSIPVESINGVGLTYDEVEFAAFQDKLKTALANHANAPIEISGPWDTSAAATAPTLSGSHTVLSNLAGSNILVSIGVFFGIRHAWEAGEPVYGISKSATNGYTCTSYQVDPSTGKYTAKFMPAPGSDAPAWGTSAIS